MTLSAEIDEGCLKAWLDTGDFAFVDIRLLLLATTGLNIQVVQLLAVYKGYTQLFCLSCVDQHSFHAVRITLLGNVPDWQRRACLLCLFSSEG